MSTRLIIDGNAVYEIDEDCLKDSTVKQANELKKYSEYKKTGNRKVIKKE